MLLLEINEDEPIELLDTISGLSSIIKVFHREHNGELALAVDAPREVKINRKSRSRNNGNRRTN